MPQPGRVSSVCGTQGSKIGTVTTESEPVNVWKANTLVMIPLTNSSSKVKKEETKTTSRASVAGSFTVHLTHDSPPFLRFISLLN